MTSAGWPLPERLRSVTLLWGLLPLALLLLVGCVQLRSTSNAVPEIVTSKVKEAKRVGSAACLECHAADDLGRLMGSPHGRLLRAKDAQAAGCENCHGPGGKHVESNDAADIVNPQDMRRLSAEQRAGLCLSCHESQRPFWPTSEHARAGINCSDCHVEAFPFPHSAKEAKAGDEEGGKGDGPAAKSARRPQDVPTQISARHRNLGLSGRCLTCHTEKEAEFRRQFHHPLFEGRVGCQDCHSPHGKPATTGFWGADREVCLKCHARQRGPFVWEHQAMDDGCLACHTPHGSVNKRLLSRPSNFLCLRCHFESTFPRVGRLNHQFLLSGRAQCLDCHIQVHGSNTNRSFNPTF